MWETRELWRSYKAAIDDQDLDNALRVAWRAVKIYRPRDRHHAGIWQRAASHVLYQLDRFDEAAHAAAVSVQLLVDPYEKALSLVAEAIACRFSQDLDRARARLAYAQRLISILDPRWRSDGYFVAHFLGARGGIRRAEGRIDEAIIDFEGAAELLRQLGHGWRAALYYNNIALLELQIGSLGEAKRRLDRARECLRHAPHPHSEAVIFDTLGQVYSRMNDSLLAVRFLSRSAELFGQLGSYGRQADALFNLSLHYARKGNFRRSSKVCDEALTAAITSRNRTMVETLEHHQRSIDRIEQETTA